MEDGDPSLIEAIRKGEWRTAESMSSRDEALCEVAEKLSATPTRMVEQDWEKLRALGFDDLGCLEIVHIVGEFNHLTRLADGCGLRFDQAALTKAASRREKGRSG